MNSSALCHKSVTAHVTCHHPSHERVQREGLGVVGDTRAGCACVCVLSLTCGVVWEKVPIPITSLPRPQLVIHGIAGNWDDQIAVGKK